MELASITQLFRDRSSNEPILMMETIARKEKVMLRLSGHNTDILALEAHGLNNRCLLYNMLVECVAELGGAFGSAVVSIDPSREVSGAMSLSKRGETVWMPADVVELVAFAMHMKLPIYLKKTNGPIGGASDPLKAETGLPTVFKDALADILKPNPAPRSNTSADNCAEQHSHTESPRHSQPALDSES